MMIELPIWYEQYFWVIALAAILDLIFKPFALWYAARGRQLIWFIALFFVNLAGILPIIYLLFFRKKTAAVKPSPAKKKRR